MPFWAEDFPDKKWAYLTIFGRKHILFPAIRRRSDLLNDPGLWPAMNLSEMTKIK